MTLSWLRYPTLLCLCLLGTWASANTLRVAYDADPVSLDPYEQLSGGTLQLAHLLYDPLIRWTPKQDFEGRLATAWQRLDSRTIRFNLRHDVTFSSGNPMTALDVKWSLLRAKSSPDFKGIFKPISQARVIDSHTVDLITEQPYALLENMATQLFVMDSLHYQGFDHNQRAKDAVEKHGHSYASEHASGTGPYHVTQRQQGTLLKLTRNPVYWDHASPGNVQHISLTPIHDSATRSAALLAGDLDLIAPVPPIDHYRINKHPYIQLFTRSGARLISLQMNQQRRPELQDIRVRQAIVHAINNKGIASKIMRGFATPAGQQSPPGYQGHLASLAPRYDLALAQKLMQQAGYGSGFRLSMIAPNNRYVNDAKIAQAVVIMLAKINIKVDLVTMPKAQYWKKYDQASSDLMMLGWHSDTEDSANFSEMLAMCRNPDSGYGRYNGGHYCNPEVDRLVSASAKQTNLKKRTQMLQQVEQILYQDAAFVPLHWQHLAWGARKGINIKDVLTVMNIPYLADLVVAQP
ncbi:MAG: ABC transporter substrate-binding protein [Oceanospirillaceae bacterium]|nr:ABC transporter substrate-binding protein [Oceanospirillaceae bacterium]